MQSPRPFCSVVVPSRGRPRQLEHCLLALAETSYPRDRFEVVVVGDVMPPRARDRIVDRLGLVELRAEDLSPASARNLAGRHAQGEILAFTDDDCRPDAAWLEALASAVEVEPGAGAGGRTVNGLAANRWSVASQHIIDLAYAYYNGGGVAFLATNNLAVRAEEFRQIGGFDERFATAEDRDFCRRWLAHGLALRYVPEAIVYHEHELTLPGFLGQHFRYGRGAFRFHFGSGGATRRQLRSALGFHAALPGMLGRNGDARPSRLAEVTLWQAANGAGFAWEALVGATRRR